MIYRAYKYYPGRKGYDAWKPLEAFFKGEADAVTEALKLEFQKMVPAGADLQVKIGDFPSKVKVWEREVGPEYIALFSYSNRGVELIGIADHLTKGV